MDWERIHWHRKHDPPHHHTHTHSSSPRLPPHVMRPQHTHTHARTEACTSTQRWEERDTEGKRGKWGGERGKETEWKGGGRISCLTGPKAFRAVKRTGSYNLSLSLPPPSSTSLSPSLTLFLLSGLSDYLHPCHPLHRLQVFLAGGEIAGFSLHALCETMTTVIPSAQTGNRKQKERAAFSKTKNLRLSSRKAGILLLCNNVPWKKALTEWQLHCTEGLSKFCIPKSIPFWRLILCGRKHITLHQLPEVSK